MGQDDQPEAFVLTIGLPPDEVLSSWTEDQLARFLILQATKAIRTRVKLAFTPPGCEEVHPSFLQASEG